MEHEKKETDESLEDAVEKVQKRSEEFGGEHDPICKIMIQCLSDAYQMCVVYSNEGANPVFNYSEVAVALFRKATEGDERRDLTATFERVASWWMKREEKVTADAEASRLAFQEKLEGTITPTPKLVERGDPLISSLRNVINYILDIVDNSQSAEAGAGVLNMATAIVKEITKQTEGKE